MMGKENYEYGLKRNLRLYILYSNFFLVLKFSSFFDIFICGV